MSLSRRAAIAELLRAVGVAGSAVVALLGLGASRPTTARRAPLSIATGDVTEPRVVEDVIVVPTGDGRVRAWSRRCSHLGCSVALDGDGKALTCPCHGSRFDLGGRRLAGPAPTDLEELTVSEGAEGKLEVRRG